MPVTYEVDAERALIFTTVTGSVSAAEMFAYHRALVADPRFVPTFDSLTEFVGASTFTGTPDEIRRLAEELPFRPGARRAYVVSSDLHFGLSRLAQAHAERKGVHIEVFRDRVAALDWLRPA